ncbi:hypothetical protein ACLMNI_001175 [Campylobacter upsaliensis]
MVEPFNFNDVLEILKITLFFALVYGVGGFLGYMFVNSLFERKK